MPIHVTTSTTQSLSNKTFVDLLSTTGIVYSQGGNSTQWNNTYTTVNTNSSRYDSVFTTVNTNSAGWATGTGDVYNSNYYSSIAAPQLFNPTGTNVTNGYGDFTLATSYSVVIVSHNGQILDDSEYSQASNILTITPDNGFEDTSDEILVFQNNFPINSGLVLNITKRYTDYTATASDYTILVNASAARVNITLTSAASSSGKILNIKKIDSALNNVLLSGDGSIDGNSSLIITNQNQSMTIQCDGANWWVI